MANFNEHLNDLTSCSICTETFLDPRMLPCIHTFCLRCIEQTVAHSTKRPGDQLPCPICRKDFTIPNEGVKGLQKNFFVQSLTDMMKIAKPKDVHPCGFCATEFEGNSDASAIPEAKVYCSECKEFICDDCLRHHRKQTPTRNHNVIAIGTGVVPTEVTSQSTCDKHSNEQVKLFCLECSCPLCMLCYVGNHRSHDCKDINQVANDHRQQIQKDVTLISALIPRAANRNETIKKSVESVVARFNNIEKDFQIRAKEIHSLVDKHLKDALTELSERKWTILKGIETSRSETESHQVALQSFKSYCDELLSKASSVDICRYLRDLHSRAEDLQQTHQLQFEAAIPAFKADIRKPDLEEILESNKRNILGQIQDNYSAISGFPQCWVSPKLEKAKQYLEPFAMHSDCGGCTDLSKLLTKERFRQSGGRIVIEEIRCIENAELYRKYSDKKSLFLLNSQKRKYSKLNEETPSDVITSSSEYSCLKEMLSVRVNERLLFYKTTSDAATEICKSGFQLQNVGRLGNITILAPGILFTDSLEDQNQVHQSRMKKRASWPVATSYCMIVARVLLGNSLLSQNPRNIARLPCMCEGCFDDRCTHHGTHGSFDSIVAPANPQYLSGLHYQSTWRHFVICDPEQCYPNFLVKFQIQQ